MQKCDKKLVVAANYSHAKHYAQSIMGWKRAEWQFVRCVDDLVGLRGIVLYDVRAPKYKPTPVEARLMEEMRAYIPIIHEAGRVVKLNVYNLPT